MELLDAYTDDARPPRTTIRLAVDFRPSWLVSMVKQTLPEECKLETSTREGEVRLSFIEPDRVQKLLGESRLPELREVAELMSK